MPFQVGDRLKHPKKPDWGLGEVTASGGGYVTVCFADAGEKKLSLNFVECQLVTGEDAVNPQLDQLREETSASKLVKYRIGRVPKITASQNAQTWSILERHLVSVVSASYEQLVRLSKGHDHERGGKGFVDYCIGKRWLEVEVPEPSVPRATADQSAPENRGSGIMQDQEERPMSAEDGTPASTTDGLLQKYIQGFFGYGSLSAPLWFIGMEEGTGQDSRRASSSLARPGPVRHSGYSPVS